MRENGSLLGRKVLGPEENDSDSTITGFVLQQHLPSLLDFLSHTQASIRYAALQLIGTLLRQGKAKCSICYYYCFCYSNCYNCYCCDCYYYCFYCCYCESFYTILFFSLPYNPLFLFHFLFLFLFPFLILFLFLSPFLISYYLLSHYE